MQVDENSLAELFYTSGTSAEPKGVMLTHRNIYLHALNATLALHTDNESVELHTIPLFHANGWGVAHFLTLLGGRHVMIQKFDPLEVFRLIEAERVHHCSLVPAMVDTLGFDEPKNFERVEFLNHDVPAAKQRQKVGDAPAVGMKERNGVQFYGFIVGVQSQSSVEGVQVDVSVRQHHPLGLGAGTAGVKELGKRVFIDLHDEIGRASCRERV